MKEQDGVDKNNAQKELTNQPNSPKLEREGDVFMTEGKSDEPEQPEYPDEDPTKRPNPEPGTSGTGKDDRAKDNEPPPSPDEEHRQESGRDENSRQENTDDEAAWEETRRKAREARAREKEKLRVLFPDLTNEEFDDFEKQFRFKEIEEKIALDQMRARQERRQIGVPNSLEELAELIMKSSAPEWGKSGTKSLIYKDSEGRDRVNVINFLDWSRNNRLRVHFANPTTPINFFSDIGTSVRNDIYGSQISFYEIVFTESIFLDKVIENGKEVTKTNKDYETLRQQLLMETFLFSVTRNPDITFVATRAQREPSLKSLGEALLTNPLTRAKFFEFIFTMPSMHRKSITDLGAQGGTEMQAKQEGNYYMGDAAREALSAYMNIFDYDQLKQILGSDAPLFSLSYEDWDSETGKRRMKDEATGQLAPDKKIEPDVKYPDKRESDWFNDDGTLKLGKVNPLTRKWAPSKDGKTGIPDPDNYMKYINIFLTASPDQRQQEEIRTRIVLSIMKKNKISFREAQEAELWAYSMTHVYGVAAEMDTDAVAFDWWTRLVRFKEKRKREKADKRNAPYGGNHNLEGFKRIGLPFFEAARDIRGRSIKSIIQGGTGRNMGIEKMPLKNKVDFEKDKDGNIIFRRGEAVATEIKVKDYEVYDEEVMVEGKKQKITTVRFLDANGQEVKVGEAKPTKVTIEAVPVRFKADLQKQFLPNHMIPAAGIYEFIMSQVGLNLPELVTGYDTRANPIINQEKLIEIKKTIEHDIRYSLSTWPEINFAEKDIRAERVEVRNSQGKLVAKKKGSVISTNEKGEETYKDLFLDEDWYILDEKGMRTDQRDEPETYLRPKEMTVLESMFGVDALKYIQAEIKRHGLDKGNAENENDFVNAEDERGRRVTVDISSASNEKSDFKIAVWQGAFDYLIAAEIEAHRDRHSGLRYYDSTDMKKSSDAMIVGELATPDRVKIIRKETKTTARTVYLQDLGYAFATGGLIGFWRALQIMYKDIASGR